MIRADTELRYLKGIGPRRAGPLASAGLVTVEDLLYHLPFRYEDRRAFASIAELSEGGEERTVAATVTSSRLIRTRRRGFTIFEVLLGDESGSIRGVWYNQPYLARVLVEGRRVVLFGRAGRDRSGRPVLENPDYEFLEEDDAEGMHTGRIVPVYRKVGELSSRALRRAMFQALDELEPASLPEIVPETVARRNRLEGRLDSLRATHFPPDDVALDSLQEGTTGAHRTLVFEEIFLQGDHAKTNVWSGLIGFQ